MKKLIVLDIDGTISHKGKITKETIDAIHKAKASGNIVTIATGRNSVGIAKIAHHLGMDDGKTPIIGLNGGEVFYLKEDHSVKYVWQHKFPKKISQRIFSAAMEVGVQIYAYTDQPKYAYTNSIFTGFSIFMSSRNHSKKIKIKKDLSNLKYGITKFICFGKRKKMALFDRMIDDEKLSKFSWSYVTKAKSNEELNMPGTDKVVGLKKVCELYNIKQNDVVYFGDGGNDLESLKWAGIGVAMGNAIPQAIEASDEITKSVKDNGVAHWIEQNILRK